MEDTIQQIFKKFASQRLIFKSKDVLQMSYVPAKLPHREKEMQQLAKILGPALRFEVPSNVFIYGKPGTGKTAVVKYVGTLLEKTAREENVPVDFVYINTGLKRIANTEYRLYAELSTYFGKPVPHTGLPTSQVLDSFIEALEMERRLAIIVLDEVDNLSGKDRVLYTLSRLNSQLSNAKISIIGIANNVNVLHDLDPRTKSSLSPEEIIFNPYNADQLRDILAERAKEAFLDGVIDDVVISICAAYAAKAHGDARRALELLRVAGEIAEREASLKVTEEHVKKAIHQLEEDTIFSIVKNLPQHAKLLLKAIITYEGDYIYTGPLYERYKNLAFSVGLSPLTLRRVNDILNELDSLGIISSEVISKGRYGRTRATTLGIDSDIKERVLQLLEDEL